MKKLLLSFVIGVLIITIYPVQAQSPNLTWQQKVNQMTVTEMINYIAPQFKQDPHLRKKIMMCESGLRVLPHEGGRGVNATGIHDTTFTGWNKKYAIKHKEKLDKESMYDQIKMMSFAFSQGESYRDDWTSWVAYQKGGTYTFYSRLLKGTYTVKCK